MNWLGKEILNYLDPCDSVLDFGCGMVSATGVIGARHLGIDAYSKYLDNLSDRMITMIGTVPGVVHMFPDKSWDHVLLLDVLEHLEKEEALEVINKSKSIARKYVFVNTPEGFVEQSANDDLGHGTNPLQEHKCGFQEWELLQQEFEVTRVQQDTGDDTPVHLFAKHIVGAYFYGGGFFDEPKEDQ